MKFRIVVVSKDVDFITVTSDLFSDESDLIFITRDKSNVDVDKTKYFSILLVDFDSYDETEYEKLSINDYLIIFTTSKALISYSTICNQPAYFVFKNDLYDKISSIIKKLRNHHDNDKILIRAGRSQTKMLIKDILIVYSENHYLNIVLADETIRTRMYLNDLVDLLIKNNFVKSRGSTLVNLHHVKTIRESERVIVLNNGMHIGYSRNNQKEILKRFLEVV